MMLPVRMKTSAAKIRALGNCRKYLEKQCVFMFEASECCPILIKSPPPRLRAPPLSASINRDAEHRTSGVESSGASLTINF
jgi:hypothetical protein